LAPRVIPVELSPVQVVVLALTEGNMTAASSAATRLNDLGLRAALGASSGSIGSRIKELRATWNPFHAVVGDREAGGTPLQLRSPAGMPGGSPEEVVTTYGRRLDACRPAIDHCRLDGPFAT
jgi:threonyl-tRNA synthetase